MSSVEHGCVCDTPGSLSQAGAGCPEGCLWGRRGVRCGAVPFAHVRVPDVHFLFLNFATHFTRPKRKKINVSCYNVENETQTHMRHYTPGPDAIPVRYEKTSLRPPAELRQHFERSRNEVYIERSTAPRLVLRLGSLGLGLGLGLGLLLVLVLVLGLGFGLGLAIGPHRRRLHVAEQVAPCAWLGLGLGLGLG